MKRNYIDGAWVEVRGGAEWTSRSPADADDVLGEFAEDAEAVEEAIDAAGRAFLAWDDLGEDGRGAHLRRFGQELDRRKDAIAETIARETGKPLWESRGEASALSAKIDLTLGLGMEEVAGRLLEGSGSWIDGGYRYRPLGVCAVLGPFNFPLHLANGHIIAALATGNTVVFKPSELSPACAELYMEAADAAGLPPGVLNMVQGRRPVGERLVGSRRVEAVLFTGSVQTGLAIRRATVNEPWKLLALELGGKNTSIVLPGADVDRAAYEIGTGALLTAGQRCSATSRVIVAESLHEELLARLTRIWDNVAIGHPLDDSTFMGPLINDAAVGRFLEAAQTAREEGMEAVRVNVRHTVERNGRALKGNFVRPALWRATRPPTGTGLHDAEEIFGPDLVIHVAADAAPDEELAAWANATPYGLAMSVFSDSTDRFERLSRHLRCGVLNLNRSTVGASGALPFGGVKMSGNHRPAASLACRYCTYPVATLREARSLTTDQIMPRFPEFRPEGA